MGTFRDPDFGEKLRSHDCFILNSDACEDRSERSVHHSLFKRCLLFAQCHMRMLMPKLPHFLVMLTQSFIQHCLPVLDFRCSSGVNGRQNKTCALYSGGIP